MGRFLFFLTVIFLSVQASLAESVYTNYEINSMKESKTRIGALVIEQVEITITPSNVEKEGPQKTFVDNDGYGTLMTLYALLLDEAYTQLADTPLSLSTPVPNWQKVRSIFSRKVKVLEESYRDSQKKLEGLVASGDQSKELKDNLKLLRTAFAEIPKIQQVVDKDNVSYADLNILGNFLKRIDTIHSYEFKSPSEKTSTRMKVSEGMKLSKRNYELNDKWKEETPFVTSPHFQGLISDLSSPSAGSTFGGPQKKQIRIGI